MIVYHGTTDVIQCPDVSHSKKYLAEDLMGNEPELFAEE